MTAYWDREYIQKPDVFLSFVPSHLLHGPKLGSEDREGRWATVMKGFGLAGKLDVDTLGIQGP